MLAIIPSATLLGVEGRALTSKSNADYVPNLSSLAQQKYDLVIGVGFLMAEAVETVAKKFPDTNFAIIDFAAEELAGKPDNVRGLLFKEQEAGYLVGTLAALYVKDKGGDQVISSVGGQKIPPVDAYIAGYRAGAEKASPGIKVLNGYSQDFVDQAKCKEVALDQIAEGSDVVFQVAGGCGLATAHDFRVMRADRGFWCLPEADIGIPFTRGMSALIQARLALAGGVGEAAVLRQVAPEHLRSLADRGGATVHLAVWDGREMFFFARAIAPGGLAVDRARPGVRLPGHATGSGRVFLAHRPWSEARAWLQRDGLAADGLAALTPATTTDESAIRAALDAVRREGIAVVRDEVVVGVGQLAVPVWGPGDRVAAALGISLRTEEVDAWLARNRELLDATATALAAALRGAVAPAARDAIRALVLEV